MNVEYVLVNRVSSNRPDPETQDLILNTNDLSSTILPVGADSFLPIFGTL